jgi:hypothetical protein
VIEALHTPSSSTTGGYDSVLLAPACDVVSFPRTSCRTATRQGLQLVKSAVTATVVSMRPSNGASGAPPIRPPAAFCGQRHHVKHQGPARPSEPGAGGDATRSAAERPYSPETTLTHSPVVIQRVAQHPDRLPPYVDSASAWGPERGRYLPYR